MTDEEMVADVFNASYRRLVGQLLAISGDLRDAEDAVQEAFVRALDHRRAFSRTDNPEAWLRRVALNVQRSRWRRLRTFAGLQHKLSGPASGYEPSPDHIEMMTALNELSTVQREAIVLHHLADLPVHQVADIQGVSGSTVKTRLARGRRTLGGLLSDRGEEHHV